MQYLYFFLEAPKIYIKLVFHATNIQKKAKKSKWYLSTVVCMPNLAYICSIRNTKNNNTKKIGIMTKAKSLTQKGFVHVTTINSSKLSRIFTNMNNCGISYEFMHKNYETIAGSQYREDLYAKNAKAEQLYYDFCTLDGRKLAAFLKKAKNITEKYRLVKDRLANFNGLTEELAMGNGGVGQVKVIGNKVAYQIESGHGRHNYAQCAVMYL